MYALPFKQTDPCFHKPVPSSDVRMFLFSLLSNNIETLSFKDVQGKEVLMSQEGDWVFPLAIHI